jgi:hypothetical protein
MPSAATGSQVPPGAGSVMSTLFLPVVCPASMRSAIAESQYDHGGANSITHFCGLILPKGTSTLSTNSTIDRFCRPRTVGAADV